MTLFIYDSEGFADGNYYLIDILKGTTQDEVLNHADDIHGENNYCFSDTELINPFIA